MLEHSITMLRDDDVEIIDDDLGDLPELVDSWAADLTQAAASIEEQDTLVFRVRRTGMPRRPAARPGRARPSRCR